MRTALFSSCPACYECWWRLHVPLKTCVICYVRRTVSYSCAGCIRKPLQQIRYFSDLDVSYPSFTQIISRKNPEDVQEVRHASLWLLTHEILRNSLSTDYYPFSRLSFLASVIYLWKCCKNTHSFTHNTHWNAALSGSSTNAVGMMLITAPAFASRSYWNSNFSHSCELKCPKHRIECIISCQLCSSSRGLNLVGRNTSRLTV